MGKHDKAKLAKEQPEVITVKSVVQAAEAEAADTAEPAAEDAVAAAGVAVSAKTAKSAKPTRATRAIGDTTLFDALAEDTVEETSSFVMKEDRDLWPEPEVMHEEQVFDRSFAGEDGPRKRRRPTWKGFFRGLGRALKKIIIYLLVFAVAALVVGTAVYMIGTHTPIEQVFDVLGVFFRNLFS